MKEEELKEEELDVPVVWSFLNRPLVEIHTPHRYTGKEEISAGLFLWGTFSYWFPVVMWRGGCYAVRVRWGFPLITLHSFQLTTVGFSPPNLPLSEQYETVHKGEDLLGDPFVTVRKKRRL